MLPLTISAQDGLISQYDYFDKKIASINLTTYYILKNGEFAYNKSYSNGYPYGAIKRLDSFEEGALSSLYICFCVSNIDSNYLCYYFDSNKWNYEVKIISGEGARNHGLLNLTPSDFFNIRIFKPHTLEEQCKISNFLELIYAKEKIINRKINILKKYKEGIMIKCYELAKNQVISLSKLVKNNIILLGRVEIIPKQNGTFPVYSSSAANNGLFCFRNKYSFDEELITWSIDGGGKPFLRNKHKFSITNVCGYAKILDLNIFSYSWLYINFWNSWRKIKFDYTTKAHPSVIEKLYKIKSLDIESQMKIEKILTYINNKIDYLIKELNDVTLTKESLLRSLFF